MNRSIKLIGNNDAVDLILDGQKVMPFRQDKAINALDLYQALDYHPGDKYTVGDCSCDLIPEGAFNSLKSLIEEIAEGINAIRLEENPIEEAQIYTTTYCDDDIPF